MDRYGFLKTAAAIPSVRVADCAYNGERIAALVAALTTDDFKAYLAETFGDAVQPAF